MKKNLLVLIGMVVLALAACASAQAPTSTPVGIRPGEAITIPAPGEGPTVENPTLHLVITVRDAETRQPVLATVTVDDKIVQRDTDRMEILVSALETHSISVEAAGYDDFAVGVESHVVRHKTFKIPVLLKRLPPGESL